MFSQRLRQLREERELIQKDMAELLGITTSAYGFYEQGKHEPDLTTLCKLADFFEVSIDYLVGRELKGRGVKTKEDPMADLSPEARRSVEDYIRFLRKESKQERK